MQQIKLAAGTFIIMALFFHQQSYPSRSPLLEPVSAVIGCPTRLTNRDASNRCVRQEIVKAQKDRPGSRHSGPSFGPPGASLRFQGVAYQGGSNKSQESFGTRAGLATASWFDDDTDLSRNNCKSSIHADSEQTGGCTVSDFVKRCMCVERVTLQIIHLSPRACRKYVQMTAALLLLLQLTLRHCYSWWLCCYCCGCSSWGCESSRRVTRALR